MPDTNSSKIENPYRVKLNLAIKIADMIDGNFDYEIKEFGFDKDRKCPKYQIAISHSDFRMMSQLKKKCHDSHIDYRSRGDMEIVIKPDLGPFSKPMPIRQPNSTTTVEVKAVPAPVVVVLKPKPTPTPISILKREPVVKKEKVVPVVVAKEPEVVEIQFQLADCRDLKEENDFLDLYLPKKGFRVGRRPGSKITDRKGRVDSGIYRYQVLDGHEKEFQDSLFSAGYPKEQVIVSRRVRFSDKVAVTLFLNHRPKLSSALEKLSDEDIFNEVTSRPSLFQRIQNY